LALGRDVLGLGPAEPTLASVLQQSGYATASFAAANPYISSRFGYERGFDTFRDFLEEEPAPLTNETANAAAGWAGRFNRRLQNALPKSGTLRSAYEQLYFEYCQRVTPVPGSLDPLRRFPAADVIVDEACTWLKSQSQSSFFLWLHLMDPHSPYYPKAEALSLMGDKPLTPFQARYLNSFWNRSDLQPKQLALRRGEIVSLYDAGIRWVDVQMEKLCKALQALNRWDDCAFAFTADHGEEFLDHGGRYHPPSRLMEELIRVPLLLRVPGLAKKQLTSSPFSMLHLAPTLLDGVGLSAPREFRGRSHWHELAGDGQFDGVAISESVAGCTNPFRRENRLGPRVLSVRESRFKLLLYFDPFATELYDLDADPHEHAALGPSVHEQVRRRLLEIAREHLSQSAANRNLRARVEAQLRDLRLEWKKPAHNHAPVAS
jgi:arylsulfatase A-like enzyme